MFRTLKWVTPVAVLALLFSLSNAASAQETEKKDTGSIAGTIMDKDGKPASGVQVRLFHPFERGQRGAAAAKAKEQNADPAAPADGGGAAQEKPDKAQKPRKADRPKPVATATTDNDGKFTMTDVAAGKYVVLAMLRGQGHARQDVEVTAGQAANVELKLKERTEKSGKRAEKKPAPAAE